MGNPYFRFRQFTVYHDRCAMKVGTDGVLLGAWSCPTDRSVTSSLTTLSSTTIDTPLSIQTLPRPYPALTSTLRILDIGTGSGLIALMLAQRFSETHIDAIDIDLSAVEQASINFANSPWAERLSAHLSALQNYAAEWAYDMIVSNPPYFQNSLKNPDKGREQARHTDSLSYVDLFCHANRLLSKEGCLSLILPAEAEEEIISIARRYELYPTRLTRVYSKEGKPAKRILIAFSRATFPYSLIPEIFYIEGQDTPRSREYTALMSDFYL